MEIIKSKGEYKIYYHQDDENYTVEIKIGKSRIRQILLTTANRAAAERYFDKLNNQSV